MNSYVQVSTGDNISFNQNTKQFYNKSQSNRSNSGDLNKKRKSFFSIILAFLFSQIKILKFFLQISF